MASMTLERKTKKLSEQAVINLLHQPAKANAKVYLGSLVVLEAGFVTPGRTATGLIAIGVAEQTVDNTGGADGALFVPIRQGAWLFFNAGGGDVITQADVGKDCFIVDDQTVAKTDAGATRSRAGKIMGLEPDGMVWVQLGIGL